MQWFPNLFFLKCRLLSFTFPAQRRKGQPRGAQWLAQPHQQQGAGPGPGHGLSHPTDTVHPRYLLPSLTRWHLPLVTLLLSPSGLAHLVCYCLPSSSLPASLILGSLLTRKGPFRAEPAAHLLRPGPFLSLLAPQPFGSIPGPAVPVHRWLACPLPASSILSFLSSGTFGLYSSPSPLRGPKPAHIYLLPPFSLLCPVPSTPSSVLGGCLVSKLAALGSGPHFSSAGAP